MVSPRVENASQQATCDLELKFFAARMMSGPASRSSLAEEYSAMASSSGLIDRSHLTKLKLVGNDALDLLQRISTNDLSKVEPGGASRTVLTTEKGRVVDFITVYALKGGSVLILSHCPAQVLADWIGQFIIMEDVKVVDVTLQYGVLSAVGPESQKILEVIGMKSLDNWSFKKVFEWDLEEAHVLVTPIDLIGLVGWNLLVPNIENKRLGTRIMEDVRQYGIGQCSDLALEILRVEKGIPLFGHELTEDVNPLEAGLRDYVSFSKGCYIGQEVLARLDTYKKLQKRLVGLVARGEHEIGQSSQVSRGEHLVGQVTSSAYSFLLSGAIALAYLRAPVAKPGTRVQIHSGNQELDADVVDLPFL